MGSEHRAHGMAHRVDRPQPLLERRRPHHRGRHHRRPRLEIRTALVCAGQIRDHQPHPLEGDSLAHRMEMRAAEGLDAVREGVESGPRRDRRGHSNRRLGIADDRDGQHPGMEDDLLHAGEGVGQHPGAAHLRSGARRRGHGDDRRDGVGVGPRPPVADILEIPHRTGLPGHERHQLSRVQRRAAAKRHDSVVPARAKRLHPGLQIALVGIGIDLAEHAAPQTGGVEQIEGAGRHRQLRQRPVGDQQRRADSGLGAGLGQLGDPAGPESDRGGIGPVSGERHRASPAAAGPSGLPRRPARSTQNCQATLPDLAPRVACHSIASARTASSKSRPPAWQ